MTLLFDATGCLLGIFYVLGFCDGACPRGPVAFPALLDSRTRSLGVCMRA